MRAWTPLAIEIFPIEHCGRRPPSPDRLCGKQKEQGAFMDLLKLVALDNDDIEVLSAHVQDSIVTVGDIMWRPAEKRVIVVINRFDWESAQSLSPPFRRRRAALRFERVNAVKHRHVACTEKDTVLNLLAVEFTATDAPAGHVTLIFSGGAALRLDVECLEAELADLGPAWATGACPAHAVEADRVRTA
jgi:Protein of unknown function (DUF2948)